MTETELSSAARSVTESCHGVRHAGRLPFPIRHAYEQATRVVVEARELAAPPLAVSTRTHDGGHRVFGAAADDQFVPMYGIIDESKATNGRQGPMIIRAAETPRSGRIPQHAAPQADGRRKTLPSPDTT